MNKLVYIKECIQYSVVLNNNKKKCFQKKFLIKNETSIKKLRPIQSNKLKEIYNV